jgi:hypothetical protein
MKKSSNFILLTSFLVLITLMSIWSLVEYQESFSEPNEAIYAENKDLLLIPAYKLGEESLFFFIKGKNNLGAVYAFKGLFGWKCGMLTSGPVDPKREFDRLEGYQAHGEKLIYGLFRKGDEQVVTVDDQEANVLNLALLSPPVVKEYKLEDVYLWYFEKDSGVAYEQIKLVQKDTGEIIQSIDL